ncbi:MAG: hypothetical protein HYR72_00965 [Deltaproteobacteria bacterium]|nr:hypothetical protein [Deltaproteobacteria bacterium]MBI3391312.1 hypothetical protein [Deltaproteobacteria bacterium]
MRRRRRFSALAAFAWLASAGALAISAWLIWHAYSTAPRRAPSAVAPPANVTADDPNEVTDEERRALEAILRGKGTPRP